MGHRQPAAFLVEKVVLGCRVRNPFGAFGACLLFGFASALAIPLQREADISANLLSTLPYVLTLVALVGVIGRSVGPAAVGRPYTKG